MKPDTVNQNLLVFFDRALESQRSQLLTVMADAVSECRMRKRLLIKQKKRQINWFPKRRQQS